MSVNQTIDAFWESARRGIYMPAEWKGRLTREDAYRVQLGMLERYVRDGDRHAGWKVGLTAKAMQVQQGVHEPVFGFLLASGARPSGRASATPTSSAPDSRTSSAERWAGRCAAGDHHRAGGGRSVGGGARAGDHRAPR